MGETLENQLENQWTTMGKTLESQWKPWENIKNTLENHGKTKEKHGKTIGQPWEKHEKQIWKKTLDNNEKA